MTTFVVEGGRQRLDRLVARELPDLSRSRIKALINEGAVLVDGQRRKPSSSPGRGAVVQVRVPELRVSPLEPQDLGVRVLHEDSDVAVVVKPAGMVVHPSKGHSDGTLVNAMLYAVRDLSGIGGEQRPGIVHRLDKGTSGVMVVAKHDQAHRALQAQFAVHSVHRAYHALVLNAPDLDCGRIENQLGRAANDRFRFTRVAEGQGKAARTRWRVVERLKGATLLRCELETGRTHQVRVHLSESGQPLLGDPLYRARFTYPPAIAALLTDVDHQLLHARELAFDHPTTQQRLHFEVEPPDDFQRVLDGLRALD